MPPGVGHRRSLTYPAAAAWVIGYLLVGFSITMVVVTGWLWVVVGNVTVGLHDFQGMSDQQIRVFGWAQLLGFSGATWLLGRYGLGLTWSELRLVSLRQGSWRFGRAMVVGSVMLGLVAAPTPVPQRPFHLVSEVIVFLPSALSEELMVRGFVLVVMTRVLGWRLAVVLVSGVYFAILHLATPGITVLGLVNITLAGLWLGLLVQTPGGLWASTGAHLGWNVAVAMLGFREAGVEVLGSGHASLVLGLATVVTYSGLIRGKPLCQRS